MGKEYPRIIATASFAASPAISVCVAHAVQREDAAPRVPYIDAKL
jgi:hypothetical protein